MSDVEIAAELKAIKPDLPTMLFLSNLIESKGVVVLLKACQIQKQRGIDFRCHFVGGEGDVTRNQFENHCRELELNEELAYLGKRYGADKAEVFAQATVFCLPTFYHNECLPLVILEAMQWRLPVVSTPEGGIQDLVIEDETGFLVPQNDAYALADKLELILSDPDLCQRMGFAGRQHYENHFTERHFETRLKSILDRICAGV
jgi:glycosyltransferase involved in cell wall biosynthesis